MKTVTGKYGGRYYVVDEAKGISYPSVTTILGETSDKTWLKEWEERVGKEKVEKVSTFAANRGTYMHTLHENMLDLMFNENIDYKAAYRQAYELTNEHLRGQDFPDEVIECGLKLFSQFYATDFYQGLEGVIFQERAVYAPFEGGYAGRLDLLANKDGKVKLIDFKSSKSPKSINSIENYLLQGAAYSIACKNVYDILPEEVEIWISCEVGGVQTFSYGRDEMKKYIRQFLAKVRQYHKMIEEKDANS